MRSTLASIALTLATACPLVLAACDGDDDGGDDTGTADAGPTADAMPTTPTLADICDADDGLFPELFGKFIACNPEFEIFFGRPLTAADFEKVCEGQFGPFITDGTITIGDSAALAACAAEVAAIDCTTVDIDELSACDDVFDGQVPNGSPCDTEEQCAEGSYCTDTMTLCGTCTDKVANGQSCDTANACDSGRCVFPAMGPGPGTCQALAAAGGACTSDSDCLGANACLGDVCAARPTVAMGAACNPDFEQGLADCNTFRSGLFCKPGAMNMGTCQPWAQVGAACVALGAPDGNWCDLTAYETCGMDAKCKAPTIQQLGQPCYVVTGQKCGAGLRCTDGFDAAGQCEALPVVGDACVDTGDCDVFMECVNDKCQYGEHSGMCPAP